MHKNPDKLAMASPRMEALGDGIFSVAMTILAIELTVPVLKENNWSNIIAAFHESWHELLCYVISFIILGIMWFAHTLVFQFIERVNRYFIFFGVLFYLFVCLVPFSTRIIANNTLYWFSIAVYGINLSLCNLTLFAQWRYGCAHKQLLNREVPAEIQKQATFLFLLSPVVYAIAIIIAFFAPVISICIFIITPIIYLLPNKLDKYLP